MLSIKVQLRYLNEIRKILMESGIIDMNYKILAEDSYGYIPLKEKISKNKLEDIQNMLNENINSPNYDNSDIVIKITEKELKAMKKYPKSITEHLNGKLDESEIEDLKKSFDIIGDIVILEIPEELEKHKAIIGKAALNFTKRKSVFMKKGAIEGITRTRQIEHIAGENNPETIHKEHGIRLKLDVKNVYFSPRLATERKRVAEQIKDGETILDMFAGIGPFPILIAKNKNVNIYAVDINKEAIQYMEENIELNKLKGNITPFLGDVNQIAKKFKVKGGKVEKGEECEKFDRIIMNLPGTAYEFLDLAISLIKDNGIVHYYEFSDSYEQGIKRLEESAKKFNKQIKVLNSRKVKSSSPGMWHVVIDAEIVNRPFIK